MQPRKPRLMLPDGHLGIKVSKSSSSILHCVAKNKPFFVNSLLEKRICCMESYLQAFKHLGNRNLSLVDEQ